MSPVPKHRAVQYKVHSQMNRFSHRDYVVVSEKKGKDGVLYLIMESPNGKKRVFISRKDGSVRIQDLTKRSLFGETSI